MTVINDEVLIRILTSYDKFISNCDENCNCTDCVLSFKNKYECFIYHLMRRQVEEV